MLNSCLKSCFPIPFPCFDPTKKKIKQHPSYTNKHNRTFTVGKTHLYPFPFPDFAYKKTQSHSTLSQPPHARLPTTVSSLRRNRRERRQHTTNCRPCTQRNPATLRLPRCSTAQSTARVHRQPRTTVQDHWPAPSPTWQQSQTPTHGGEQQPRFRTTSAQVNHSRTLTAPYRKTPQKRTALIPEGKNRSSYLLKSEKTKDED